MGSHGRSLAAQCLKKPFTNSLKKMGGKRSKYLEDENRLKWLGRVSHFWNNLEIVLLPLKKVQMEMLHNRFNSFDEIPFTPWMQILK